MTIRFLFCLRISIERTPQKVPNPKNSCDSETLWHLMSPKCQFPSDHYKSNGFVIRSQSSRFIDISIFDKESRIWAQNPRSVAINDNMLFISDSRPKINSSASDSNQIESQVIRCSQGEESYQRSQWNGGIEAIDLLTSPKFQMTVPKEEPSEGLLDLECLYYDQLDCNSSPEMVAPKKELFELSIGSQLYANESQSVDSIASTNLQSFSRTQSHLSYASDPNLETIADPFALEPSIGYSAVDSSSTPNMCQWIDCFSVFRTQEELVRHEQRWTASDLRSALGGAPREGSHRPEALQRRVYLLLAQLSANVSTLQCQI